MYIVPHEVSGSMSQHAHGGQGARSLPVHTNTTTEDRALHIAITMSTSYQHLTLKHITTPPWNSFAADHARLLQLCVDLPQTG